MVHIYIMLSKMIMYLILIIQAVYIPFVIALQCTRMEYIYNRYYLYLFFILPMLKIDLNCITICNNLYTICIQLK